jgi:hypothetical protein
VVTRVIFIGAGGGFGIHRPLAVLLDFYATAAPGPAVPAALPRRALHDHTEHAPGIPAGLGAGGTSARPAPHWQAPQQEWQPPQQPSCPRSWPADVGSLRDRLGHDVRSLEPARTRCRGRPWPDASERYSTASTLLERAGSDAQLRTAWLAAVEGLHATSVVRQRQGLDLGPPVPLCRGAARS